MVSELATIFLLVIAIRPLVTCYCVNQFQKGKKKSDSLLSRVFKAFRIYVVATLLDHISQTIIYIYIYVPARVAGTKEESWAT